MADTITEYGLRCTFNLNGGTGEFGANITPDEVREHFIDKGHEIFTSYETIKRYLTDLDIVL